MSKIKIVKLISYFLLLILNILGTLAWIILYLEKRYTEWWVFLIIIICIFATISYAVKIIKELKNK